MVHHELWNTSGGYLSLLKFVTFINSLLIELKESNLCIRINEIKCVPVGYADDMSAATTSKPKLDKVIDIVHNHGKKWRYGYNARKSAVLVYRETKREWVENSKHRVFKLGDQRVKEKDKYEHVGVTCTTPYCETSQIDERVSKGRKSSECVRWPWYKKEWT